MYEMNEIDEQPIVLIMREELRRRIDVLSIALEKISMRTQKGTVDLIVSHIVNPDTTKDAEIFKIAEMAMRDVHGDNWFPYFPHERNTIQELMAAAAAAKAAKHAEKEAGTEPAPSGLENW